MLAYFAVVFGISYF